MKENRSQENRKPARDSRAVQHDVQIVVDGQQVAALRPNGSFVVTTNGPVSFGELVEAVGRLMALTRRMMGAG